MIPKILHFCFGMSPSDKPWSLIHHVCVKSAVERIRPQIAYFYSEYEPAGPWWELTRPMVTLEKVLAPREIFGRPLLHPAHRADVLRLQKLIERGGIYLDVDTFVHRGFDDLLGHRMALGEIRFDGTLVGLGIGVILAEARSSFLARWLAEYRSFRSKGNDQYWDEHSVRTPCKLAEQFPDEIAVLPSSAFYEPSFTKEGLKRIYSSIDPIDVSKSFATHLWESPAWVGYLQHLTPGRVRRVGSNFHRWARPMLETLPDNYGAPTIADRVVCNFERVRNRLQSVVRSATSLLSER